MSQSRLITNILLSYTVITTIAHKDNCTNYDTIIEVIITNNISRTLNNIFFS